MNDLSEIRTIMQTAMRMLSTGDYHIYRGVLSGEGASIRATFNIALGELVKSGDAREDIANEQRAMLADAIKHVG